MFFPRLTVLKDICDITQHIWLPDFITKEQVKVVGANVTKIAVVPKYSFEPLRNRDKR